MPADFDDKILAKLGMNETQAQELIKKHHAFITSLSPERAEAVKKSFPSMEEVAKSIGTDVTADHLQDFVGQRCLGEGSGALAPWVGWPIPTIPLDKH